MQYYKQHRSQRPNFLIVVGIFVTLGIVVTSTFPTLGF